MTGKSTIVLISGANQGIGFATSKRLATEYPGYHILMGARDPEKGKKAVEELQKNGLSVEFVQLDLSSNESIAAAAKYIGDAYGHLDVLINNAGMGYYRDDGTDRRKVFSHTMDTNVTGHVVVTEAMLPLLEKSSQTRRIVFVSSGLGSHTLKENNPADFLAYRCSKSAVNMVMQHFAVMLQDKGYRVNSVCPGFCSTNLNEYEGVNTPEQGATQLIAMATIGADGPNGTFSRSETALGW